jgi:HPt (histidine-containing phosphotransfer) domain-containing protein
MTPQAVALFPQFLANRVRDLARCREALVRGDLELVARLGHNMRGNGVSFGLPRVSTIGGQIEDAANTNDVAALGALLDALEAYVAIVRASGEPDRSAAPRPSPSGVRARVEAPTQATPHEKKRPRG